MTQTITALQPQKRDPGRVNVFLDGVYAFSLNNAVAARLAVGTELDDEGRALIEQQELVETARRKAEGYLAYRPRSVLEVRSRLQREGLHEEIIDTIVAGLVQRGLLDEEAFARYWIEQRESFRPRSELALRRELQQKGVARNVIDSALAGQNDLDSARRAAQARLHHWTGLPQDIFERKASGYLQRRGFSYGVCKKVIAELWAEADANYDE